METERDIEYLLKQCIGAEMAIRSITTRLHEIRESLNEIEEYRNKYADIRLENFFSKDSNTLNPDSVKKEEHLKKLVESLEYVLTEKIVNHRNKINEDVESLNQSTSKIPKSISYKMLGMPNL